MSWKYATPALAALCVFQAGLIFGRFAPLDAHAEEPAVDQGFYDPPRLRCRSFPVPVEGAGTLFETNDRTTEIGRWLETEERRYELFSIDFEVGQKPTGYPTAFAWVCLSPRR
jgi:hypothetical protein